MSSALEHQLVGTDFFKPENNEMSLKVLNTFFKGVSGTRTGSSTWLTMTFFQKDMNIWFQIQKCFKIFLNCNLK